MKVLSIHPADDRSNWYNLVIRRQDDRGGGQVRTLRKKTKGMGSKIRLVSYYL